MPGEYRGIQGNARGTYGSGYKVPAECWGMLSWSKVLGKCRSEECWGMYGDGCNVPGEYREYRAMQESGCKIPEECRRMQRNARGMYWSVCQVQWNAGKFNGMPGECMGVGANCQVNAGNAGECQGNGGEYR